MQGQLAADHLLRDLAHQLEQFFAPGVLILPLEVLEALHHPIQNLAGVIEGLLALAAAFCQSLFLAFLQALLIAFAPSGVLAQRQPFLIALLRAFLIAVSDRLLQGGRITAGARRAELLHRRARPGRKPEWTPAQLAAFDYLDGHVSLAQPTVCSRKSCNCSSP